MWLGVTIPYKGRWRVLHRKGLCLSPFSEGTRVGESISKVSCLPGNELELEDQPDPEGRESWGGIYEKIG